MSATPIRRQPAVVRTPLAHLIGANVTLEMRASDAWVILDALEGRAHLTATNREELAELLREVLTQRPRLGATP